MDIKRLMMPPKKNHIKKAKSSLTKGPQSEHDPILSDFISAQNIFSQLKNEQTLAALSKAIKLATDTINNGGRVFTFGAGTSGRLAVLDASEIAPTFGIKNLFIGLIAGGKKALTQAVEGAEDDEQILVHQIQKYRPKSKDLLFGVACSGNTPCVLGLLKHGQKKIKCKTILISAQPTKHSFVNIAICGNLPQEFVKGSSRLSCGTFTKVVLNTISTLSLIKAGRTHKGLMIFVQPSNVKLRNRMAEIYATLTGTAISEAQVLLESNQYQLPELLLVNYGAPSIKKAKTLLRIAGGNFNKALGLLHHI